MQKNAADTRPTSGFFDQFHVKMTILRSNQRFCWNVAGNSLKDSEALSEQGVGPEVRYGNNEVLNDQLRAHGLHEDEKRKGPEVRKSKFAERVKLRASEIRVLIF